MLDCACLFAWVYLYVCLGVHTSESPPPTAATPHPLQAECCVHCGADATRCTAFSLSVRVRVRVRVKVRVRVRVRVRILVTG